MLEVVRRHGAVLNPDLKTVLEKGSLPEVIYVDKLCCGGTEGSRADAVRYFFGMLKKLDAFHLIQRIGREMNCEHPRKGGFLKSLSQCIFTHVQEDVDQLENAREAGGFNNLTDREKKADMMRYVRTRIVDPERIVSKILVLVKGQIALDRHAKQQSIAAGDKCEDINTAHPAYPLITKKILKCVMQQCIHLLNGCVDDVDDMNVLTGASFYRGTAIALATYISQRGSSCAEAWHSVADRKFYAITIMGKALFDARMLWHVVNYNRERLRKLGRDNVLADGVAPSEGSRQIRSTFVESTDLLFGFGYYNHVTTTEMEARVEDAILEAIENDDTLEIEDVFDDDATDEEYDYSDSHEDDSNAPLEDYDESIFEPLMTKNISERVDLEELKALSGTLGEDVEWTATANPMAVEQPLQDGQLQETIDKYPSFRDLVARADDVAAEAGIDVEANNFSSITADTFEASKQARSKRNVANRTERSGGGKTVAPNFNKVMEAKFKEIWFDKRNPSQGKEIGEWCTWAMIEYEKWRFDELIAADEGGGTVPPLHRTSYDLVKKWATQMKETSSKAQRKGAFSTVSSELSSKLESFTPTSSSLESLKMAEPTNAADLSVTVVTNADISQVSFLPPLSGRVEKEMDELLSKKPSPKKKRKTSSPPDEEFLRRQRAAVETMSKFGLAPDQATSKKKRCAVCGLIKKDFYFHPEHGKSTKEKGMKHFNTRGPGQLQFSFCPLADDPSIYFNWKTQKAEQKAQNNKMQYLKLKGST